MNKDWCNISFIDTKSKSYELKVFSWTRIISQQHRLVYQIFETEVLVLIIAACEHYNDK
jgi:Txe/YoeB family toxin of Txe-Axe toxin-antitoxin module